MDIVKPQNITKKFKKLGKSILKKLDEIYLALIFFPALFTSRKAIELTWFEFNSFDNYKGRYKSCC